MAKILCDLPEIEYLDGKAYRKVSPKTSHGLVQRMLSGILAECAGERGYVVTEVRFNLLPYRLSKTEFLPDIAFIEKSRMQGLSADELEEPPFSPDIAIEVRSKYDRLPYLQQKIDAYLATGCVLALDVDPAQRRIIAHAKSGTRSYDAGDTFAHQAVQWLHFPVASAFVGLDKLGRGSTNSR